MTNIRSIWWTYRATFISVKEHNTIFFEIENAFVNENIDYDGHNLKNSNIVLKLLFIIIIIH